MIKFVYEWISSKADMGLHHFLTLSVRPLITHQYKRKGKKVITPGKELGERTGEKNDAAGPTNDEEYK